MNETKHPSYTPFAVVTGASSGIGYELAMQFAENGFDLLIAAEDEGIYDVVQEFEAFGAEVKCLQADLAAYDGVERLYAMIQSLGRPVDAIAINAGIGVGGSFLRDTDLKDELNLIALNVTSVVHLAKRVAADMVERGEGRILFTSSIAATMPGPYEAVYSGSKAFVQSFANSLREELKDTGVTITVLMPGATDTNFFHRAGMDDTKVGSEEKHENDPMDVARQGFEALMAGKDEVVSASVKTKIWAAANKVLPESLKGKLHKEFSEPGSAHT